MGVVVAAVAFISGVALGASVSDGQRRPNAPTIDPTSTVLATPAASASQQVTSVAPGAYRLQPPEVYELARVADFFRAYNTGDLKAVMALLDHAPRLSDCDYRTGSLVLIEGRQAIEAYLGDRFAEHDSWVVELFNENPQSVDLVGVQPLQRQNDTLLALGVPGGVKRDFGVSLSITLASENRDLSVLAFANDGASPGAVGRLCRP